MGHEFPDAVTFWENAKRKNWDFSDVTLNPQLQIIITFAGFPIFQEHNYLTQVLLHLTDLRAK